MCNSFCNIRHVKFIEIKCFLVQNGRANAECKEKNLNSATNSDKNMESVTKNLLLTNEA